MQGTVQRLVMGDGPPRVEHRTRDLASLFTETEWGWSADPDDAYVFRQFEPGLLPSTAYEISAESHAAAVKAAGEPHCHACVHGSEAKALRRIRHASREAALDAQVREFRTPPEKTYEQTRRLLGERD